MAEILVAIAQYTEIDHTLFTDVLEYVLLANDVRDPKEFVEALKEKAGTYKGDVMTVADYLKQQGKQEGVHEGVLLTAKNMLNKGFDVKTIKEVTGLSAEELAKINTKH